MDIKSVLKLNAYRNIPLWYDQAYELGLYLLMGCKGDKTAMMESVIVLSALHNKALYHHQGDDKTTPHSAAEQIAGICAAVFNEDIAKSQFGFVRPDVPVAMDNCGMGGDLIITANVSTLSAFIVATAGIPMCKHGSPANADKGRHGSSDFIDLCGINRFADKQTIEASVKRYNFAYTEALDTRYKHIHKQTHGFVNLPHMNDIIGPITNPVDPKIMSRRVLGVNHLVPTRVVAEAYHILNQKKVMYMDHLLVVRGLISEDSDEGIDELSICHGGTEVSELCDGEIKTYHLYAANFGVQEASVADISPPENVSKGNFSMQILCGERGGSVLDMICANAALLFYLNNPTLSWVKAYQAAYDTFLTGKVPEMKDEVAKLCR